MAFVKSLLYFVVPFLFSVNETEAAVYELTGLDQIPVNLFHIHVLL